MPPRYRAVLFDFDGTLADSYAAITDSVNFVRSLHSLAPLDEPTVRGQVGHGLLQLMAEVVPGGDPKADAEQYLKHHPSVMNSRTRLLPGVAQTLEATHAAGLRLAVCSNKPVAITRELLRTLGISGYFDAALGPEDAGKAKPDPAMVELALKQLGIAANEAVYVGDMPVDVQTARNAGLAVWVLPTGSSDLETLRFANPDRIFMTMSELLPELMSSAQEKSYDKK